MGHSPAKRPEYGNWVPSRLVVITGAITIFLGGLSFVFFQKASASDLPFDDEAFDVAVSNLVFHEVSDAKDKKDVIREALRVVRKGGRFVFQDLFLFFFGREYTVTSIICSKRSEAGGSRAWNS